MQPLIPSALSAWQDPLVKTAFLKAFDSDTLPQFLNEHNSPLTKQIIQIMQIWRDHCHVSSSSYRRTDIENPELVLDDVLAGFHWIETGEMETEDGEKSYVYCITRQDNRYATLMFPHRYFPKMPRVIALSLTNTQAPLLVEAMPVEHAQEMGWVGALEAPFVRPEDSQTAPLSAREERAAFCTHAQMGISQKLLREAEENLERFTNLSLNQQRFLAEAKKLQESGCKAEYLRTMFTTPPTFDLHTQFSQDFPRFIRACKEGRNRAYLLEALQKGFTQFSFPPSYRLSITEELDWDEIAELMRSWRTETLCDLAYSAFTLQIPDIIQIQIIEEIEHAFHDQKVRNQDMGHHNPDCHSASFIDLKIFMGSIPHVTFPLSYPKYQDRRFIALCIGSNRPMLIKIKATFSPDSLPSLPEEDCPRLESTADIEQANNESLSLPYTHLVSSHEEERREQYGDSYPLIKELSIHAMLSPMVRRVYNTALTRFQRVKGHTIGLDVMFTSDVPLADFSCYTGTIRINPHVATTSVHRLYELLFELTNCFHSPEHIYLMKQAHRKKIDCEPFVKAVEEVENRGTWMLYMFTQFISGEPLWQTMWESYHPLSELSLYPTPLPFEQAWEQVRNTSHAAGYRDMYKYLQEEDESSL